MTRALILLLIPAFGCKHGWSDTGEEGAGPVRTRSFDFAATALILSEHGDLGVMATAQGVSTFDTSSGAGLASTGEADFAEATVEDWVGESVAIVDRSADAGVFLWTPGAVGYDERVDEEAGGRASLARGWSGGLAWVARRGDTCRFLRDGLPTANLEACGYLRAAAVIPEDGTLFLGRDDDQGGLQLLRLDPSGALVELGGPVDLLDWDDVLGTLYAADDGGSEVRALTREGGPAFGLTLDGPVLDLVALDGVGKLAVLAGEGTDVAVRVFDAYTGLEVTAFEAGSSARFLAASADGGTIAVVQPDRMVVMTVDWDALLEDTGQ